MKSNTYYSNLNGGIRICLTLSFLTKGTTYPVGQSSVDLWLDTVDGFHECGMHHIAHKVDEAVCNVVEKCGVEK